MPIFASRILPAIVLLPFDVMSVFIAPVPAYNMLIAFAFDVH
jgi:hypothetical protein